MPKTKLFSVTIDDCEIETFTVGGHGGSGKDTSNTGVRIRHRDSGAVGRAVDSRRQSENKRLAFVRMANTREFQTWLRLEAARRSGRPSVESQVEEAMRPENLKIETRTADGWKPYDAT